MLDGVEPLPAETVAVEESLGRIAAEPLAARLTLPPWDNSAMDGFAVRSDDIADATAERPVHLRVVGEVAAGRVPERGVERGTALRILTGAIVPAGADAVVPVEDTDAPAGVADLPDSVAIHSAAGPGAHVRHAGSDLEAGMPLLAPGAEIGPSAIGLLIAAGWARIQVYRRPRLAVLSTGDELAPSGEALAPGRIHDSNGPTLAAQARLAGADVERLGIVPDELEAVVERLASGIERAEVVVVSGGVSVGARDVVKAGFERLGRLEVWRVAVQPGKPLAFARARRQGTGTALLFGLPGNPVSSFVTFELFVRPVLRRLAGRIDPLGAPTVPARLAEPVRTDPDRRSFVRVAVETDPDRADGWLARPSGGQGSHVLSALAAADGLAVVPEGIENLPAGAEVEVRLLDRAERIR
jgi:molybdopterin molybdotransferase